jgi:hypothetical protein
MLPEQLATLKAAILAEADASFVAARTAGATSAMADFFNALASPAYYVWRRVYTPEQIADAIEIGITQLDALTAAKREVLLWWAERPHNPANSQTAIADMCGSQNTLKAAVIAGGKRKATRGEKLFATGNGSEATPSTAGYEGAISADDVSLALSD